MVVHKIVSKTVDRLRGKGRALIRLLNAPCMSGASQLC